MVCQFWPIQFWPIHFWPIFFFCVVVVGFGVGKSSQLFVFACLLCVCVVCGVLCVVCFCVVVCCVFVLLCCCCCCCCVCVVGVFRASPPDPPPPDPPPPDPPPPDPPPPDRPKFRSFFFPLPPQFLLFSPSLVGPFRGILVVFEAPRPSNVHVWALGLSCETPAAPPDRAAGARTRQPENSERAHLSAPALQTPPKFHEKDQKRGRKE